MTRLLLSLSLAISLTGCVGGAATLPILDATGQALGIGLGAGWLGSKLFGTQPAPPAAAAVNPGIQMDNVRGCIVFGKTPGICHVQD